MKKINYLSFAIVISAFLISCGNNTTSSNSLTKNTDVEFEENSEEELLEELEEFEEGPTEILLYTDYYAAKGETEDESVFLRIYPNGDAAIYYYGVKWKGYWVNKQYPKGNSYGYYMEINCSGYGKHYLEVKEDGTAYESKNLANIKMGTGVRIVEIKENKEISE